MGTGWTDSAGKHGIHREDALLEVMVEVTPPRDMVIFHVMDARQSTWTG